MRAGATLAAAAAAVVVVAGPAAGHSGAGAVHPPDGARLPAPPAEVRVVHDDVLLRAGEAEVVAPGGEDLAGTPRLAARDARVLVVPVRAGAGPGRHRVRWTVTAADGHAQEGRSAFVVRPPSGPVRPGVLGGALRVVLAGA